MAVFMDLDILKQEIAIRNEVYVQVHKQASMLNFPEGENGPIYS